MREYTVTFINDKTNTFFEHWVMTRKCWSKREHRMIIDEGFFWSCQNIDYERIYAEVKSGDRVLYTVHFNTVQDGSTIITGVMIATPTAIQHYRNMVVAD